MEAIAFGVESVWDTAKRLLLHRLHQVWMSPFGGYGAAGARRVRFGAAKGFERSKRGSFALAGARWGSA